MTDPSIDIQGVRRDFADEMRRRQDERRLLQDTADVKELNRRAGAVNDGSSRFYSEEEAHAILEELGYFS